MVTTSNQVFPAAKDPTPDASPMTGVSKEWEPWDVTKVIEHYRLLSKVQVRPPEGVVTASNRASQKCKTVAKNGVNAHLADMKRRKEKSHTRVATPHLRKFEQFPFPSP